MGAGGQLGATGGTLLTQHVLKQQGGIVNPKEQDPRQAFLQHANKTDEFNRFTAAYAKTQPQGMCACLEPAGFGSALGLCWLHCVVQ